MRMSLDARLINLEQRWHEADDMSRKARTELAHSQQLTTAETLAVTARFEEAERVKKSVISLIEALEESILVS
jgi:hypothetical protein